ncbi:MAG: hypothetical protein ABSG91_22315 [Syntrophobacteraceae bacterium]|jgi:hypothetical protein
MKAALIFTGSGPILVLTTFESLLSPEFIQRLAARGISKFIAREVSLELVQKRYGTRFSIVTGDLSQKDDLRVMDIDGHHVFNSFSFEELGREIYSTPLQKSAREEVVEKGIEGEWLWAKIDEYGNIVESSYLPMLGSRIVPSIPIEAGVASKQARFRINRQGIIFDGSPQNLNGRKLVLHGRSSPALGRADTVTPACTWRADDEGGWTCI